MGSVGKSNTTTSSKSTDELKEERRQLISQYKEFLDTHADEEGVIENERDIQSLMKIQDRLDSVEYDLFNQLSPTVSEEKWKGKGITDLTRDDAITVRQDMLKNRDMYMAIASAAHGVSFNSTTSDTAVDSLYKSNPNKIYKIFEPTRKMLRQKYGDTMTLYRVPTSATAKTTINMTSSKSNAQQYADIYGGKVQSIKVPVADILAVNLKRTGGYEEFIVLNRRK